MKIDYLSQSTVPSRAANSLHVMKMCQAFARNGHNVTLTARPCVDKQTAVIDIFERYGVAKNFDLHLNPMWKVKGKVYAYALRAAFHAWQRGADLVYGRSLHSCFVSTLFGLPVVYEAHKLLPNAGKRTRWIHDLLLRSQYLRRLVVVSEALKEAYCTRFDVPDTKVRVAHDAADDPAECRQNRTELQNVELCDEGRLCVGYVGHLYPGKGMELITPLVEACPWAEFHIIGGTDEDIAYWKQQLYEHENVRFHGFIPHAETDAYRQACDVLLAPYQREVSTVSGDDDISQWMSPLKIFEYMAAGKPIVCSDLPVLREVLRHRENAWLCSPEDPGEWIDALAHLRDHPCEQEQLGEQAREDFKTNHTWKARARHVLGEISA